MGTFDVSFYSALAVGPVAGGLLNDWFGYSGMFAALLVLCLSAVGVSCFLLSNDTKNGIKRNKCDGAYQNIFQSRNLLGLLVYILSRSFGIVAVTVFLPIFMRGHFAMSHAEIGVVIGLGSILTPLLLRPAGMISDIIDRRTLVIVGGLFTALLVLCVPLANSYWQLYGFVIAIGCCSALSLPASSALLVEEGAKYGNGIAMGLFNSVMNAGFFVAPIVAGLSMDMGGVSFVFVIAGSVGVLGVAGFAYLSVPIWKRNGAVTVNKIQGVRVVSLG